VDLQEKNGTFVYSVPFSDEQGGSLGLAAFVCQLWGKENFHTSHLMNVAHDHIGRNTVLLCQQLKHSVF
jgi:hypothetical protein